MRAYVLLVLFAQYLFTACTPQFYGPAAVKTTPILRDDGFVSFDGSTLPLKVWLPEDKPAAVIIALHGYNDYSNFIVAAAGYFTSKRLAVYSYDQRGFGSAPHPGRWPGQEALCRDLEIITHLVTGKYPNTPLFLLGDSMGGAVVLAASAGGYDIRAKGMVLVAPAVWARSTMPFYQRWLLWVAAHVMPWGVVSGKGLDITPSDNEEMLRALGRDPLVLKESRIDTLYGLTNLMDTAYESAAGIDQNILLLYGRNDEIIPARPMAQVFHARLRNHYASPQRLVIYENGYHMLLRDLQAEMVWHDIVAWLADPRTELPSIKAGAAVEVSEDRQIAELQP